MEDLVVSQKVFALREMFLARLGDNWKKRLIKWVSETPGITNEQLENAYKFASCKYNMNYSEPTRKTSHENIIKKFLKQYTKVKIFTSYWIGNHCVDFYIPSINLIIEINGSVHHKEFKMRKDELKQDKLINDLRIYVMTIENWDTRALKFNLIEHIKSAKMVTHRRVKRVKRDIYIETIANIMTVDEINEHCSSDFGAVYSALNQAMMVR